MENFENCYGREFSATDNNCKSCCVQRECDRLTTIPSASIQQAPLENFFEDIGKRFKLKFTPRNDGFIAQDGDLVIDVKGGLVTVRRGENMLVEPIFLLSEADAKLKAEKVV